jgi:hypothetical protein
MGLVYRTDSFGTTRDDYGNSWRTDSFGTTRGSDGRYADFQPVSFPALPPGKRLGSHWKRLQLRN